RPLEASGSAHRGPIAGPGRPGLLPAARHHRLTLDAGNRFLLANRGHLDAVPEGGPIRDLGRGWARLRVVPGSVPVDLLVDDHVEVACDTLPAADRVRGALPEVSLVEAVPRKVVIALHDNG